MYFKLINRVFTCVLIMFKHLLKVLGKSVYRRVECKSVKLLCEMVKDCQMVSVQKPKYCKNFERNSHWRKLSMIMV